MVINCAIIRSDEGIAESQGFSGAQRSGIVVSDRRQRLADSSYLTRYADPISTHNIFMRVIGELGLQFTSVPGHIRVGILYVGVRLTVLIYLMSDVRELSLKVNG